MLSLVIERNGMRNLHFKQQEYYIVPVVIKPGVQN